MRVHLLFLFFILFFLLGCNNEKEKKHSIDSIVQCDSALVTLRGCVFCATNNKLYLNTYTNDNGSRLNLVMDSLLKQNVLEQYEANIGLLPDYQCLEATVHGCFLQKESERLYIYKRYDFYVLSLDWTDSKN
ncbi:MAG: hypothetical protein R6U19_09685 [Bacteroidales bacterium]